MKAQFATIEAGISLALVASAILFVSAWTSSSTANLHEQATILKMSTAEHDMLGAIARNATYNDCISQLYLGLGQGCLLAMEQSFSEIFSADSVSVALGASSGHLCAATLLQSAQATANVCVSAIYG